MNEPRIVIDANVSVSATLLRNSIPRRAVDFALDRGKLLISSATVTELDEVLRRPKFNRYLTEHERLEFLAALVLAAEQVDIIEQLAVCRDSKDDKYLELAVNGHATHIISGDSDLLDHHLFRGIAILTPQDFLDSLAD
jgi:putative PIN family toxin of toxin-antitoxin system